MTCYRGFILHCPVENDGLSSTQKPNLKKSFALISSNSPENALLSNKKLFFFCFCFVLLDLILFQSCSCAFKWFNQLKFQAFQLKFHILCPLVFVWFCFIFSSNSPLTSTQDTGHIHSYNSLHPHRHSCWFIFTFKHYLITLFNVIGQPIDF